MTITAKLVRVDNRHGSNAVAVQGKAHLIKLDTPLPIGTSYRSKRENPKERTTRYIFVSTSTVMGEVETYAFPCYSNGKVFDYCELRGSMRGTSDHNKVLDAMGIQLV